MIAEIKSCISPDVADLSNFRPPDKDYFFFALEYVIGVKGKEGGDLFSIEVCTPKWLSSNDNKDRSVSNKNRLIVLDYDINKILNEIKVRVESIEGASWEEIAGKISEFAFWEFEKYK